MVAQVAAADLILTTIGRVAVRPLAGYLAKNGGKKFAQQYGPKAFEAVLGTTVGLKAYKETEEYLSEYLNHIDEGGEEGSFVPKGSMPDTDRMKQMDSMMAVPNVNPNINRSIRGTPAGLVIGGEPKEVMPPPEPFSTPIDSQTGTILSTPIPEKVDTTLSTPIPEKVDTTLSTPIEDNSKPIIYYNEEVGKKMLTKESTDYRLQHKPRGPDDEYPVRLDDLTQTTTGESAGYPKDFYSEKGKRIYAPGQSFEGDEFGIANNESYSIINSVKGNPDAEVTIYRAVPNEKNITKINSGDFVTLSKRYADLHGAGGYGRDGTDSGKVLELKVKVKDIYWDQNDVNEFGYFPEKDKDVSEQTDKLVRGIGDNNPPSSIEEEPTDAVKQTDNMLGNDLSISTTLDDKLLNDLLVMRGGIKGFNERMSSEFAPMPGSTKSKMEITLQEKLFDKYDLDKYPEGKTPENSTKEESDALRKKYNTQLQGIEYIVSAAYDAIGEKGDNKNINYGYPVFTLDNEGLPIAGAKIRKFSKRSVDTNMKFNKDDPGARVKTVEALYITEMGSIDSKATTKLLNRITEIAKENKIPYVVVEDLTSEEALQAFKKRGYKGTLKKEYAPFKGRKIQRKYSNKLIRQKNLVLKIPE
jgi:hypothetical protein